MSELPESRHVNARASRSVFLVGFMGSGKSAVGQALARELGWSFLDLDDWIERQEGRTIAEIFRTDGENEFRRIERRELTRWLSDRGQPRVIALGGGAFAQPENVEIMERAQVTTVFLDAPAEVLWRRCAEDAQDRPLRRTFQDFTALYEQRRPAYLRATHCIDCTQMSAERVARQLADLLQKERQSQMESPR